MSQEQLSERGFTLVEMLVALTVFAVLAAAGVGLLRSSVDTQNAVEHRLGDASAILRLQAILASDLSHTVARPRTSAEDFAASFSGSSSSVAFLRSGLANGDARPAVQTVEWRLDGQAINRSGAAPGSTDKSNSHLLRQVSQLRFRYRAANGGWADSFQGSFEEPLPQAVEMAITRRGQPALSAIVALPPASVDGAPVKPNPVPEGAPA